MSKVGRWLNRRGDGARDADVAAATETPGAAPRRVLRALRGLLLAVWFGALAALCCVPLLRRDRILTTQANDLANHVRHVHEYGLALAEGQLPPLVAPTLEGGRRVPVFQYYTGTTYLLPGALALMRVPPYEALKAAAFLHVFAGGVFVYLSARTLGAARAPALVAGTAYALLPFGGCDFISRGSLTEFAALHTLPTVFYCGLRLVRADGRRGLLRWLCLTSLTLAYFVPLHPIQTALCGALAVALLGVHGVLDLKTGGSAPARLLAAMWLAAAASAWFWLPIVRDRGELRVTPHAGLLDAGLASWKVLLWPVYLRPEPWPWGPQVGFHFVAAAVVCAFGHRRTPNRAIGLASAAALALILVLIRWYDDVPAWLYHVLKPIQWTYRLLIPAALAGAVCLALAFDRLHRALPGRWSRGAVSAVALAYVVGIAPAYYSGQALHYVTTPQEAVSAAFESPNSSAYALRGNDYGRLALARADGSLNAGVRIPIPAEGYPTEVEMVLRPLSGDGRGGAGDDADVDVILGDPTEPSDARHPDLPRLAALRPPHNPLRWADPAARRLEKTRTADGDIRVAFSFVPTVGLTPGDTAVRFESRPAGVAWAVQDVTFRREGEPPGRACRVPQNLRQTRGGRRAQFTAEVEPGKEGLYQLPVYFLPSNDVMVNGERLAAAPSVNRALTVVSLRAGRNLIKIRTRATPAAWRLSAVTAAALAAGALAPPSKRRRSPRDELHERQAGEANKAGGGSPGR